MDTKRFLYLSCRGISPGKIATALAERGFDGKQPIGERWTGDDCEFSQPPDAKPRTTPAYADLHTKGEDERIQMIGLAAMSGRQVAFIVDSGSGDEGKMARYLFKLFANFPELEQVDELLKDYPVKNATTAKIKPKWFTPPADLAPSPAPGSVK